MPMSGVNGEFRRYSKNRPHGRYTAELWVTRRLDDGNTT